jgi:hypothetical protein
MNDEMKHIVAALLNQMHSNQDDLVVCAKWIGASMLLTVPSYMPELEQWVRLLSVTFGSITAFIGMIIMVFKLKDLLSKRKK